MESKMFREILIGVLGAVVASTFALCRPAPPTTINLIGASTPSVQARIYKASYCIPCGKYVAQVREKLPPDGWTVRDATHKQKDSADVVIVSDDNGRECQRLKIDSIPCTILFDAAGKEIDRKSGKLTPDELVDWINAERKKRK